MKRLIVAALLLIAVPVVLASAVPQGRRTEKAEKARDPVCGIMVDKNPELSASHKGETYYFCSKADMEEFKKNPDKYAKK
jgi:YHS domain-containing protein